MTMRKLKSPRAMRTRASAHLRLYIKLVWRWCPRCKQQPCVCRRQESVGELIQRGILENV